MIQIFDQLPFTLQTRLFLVLAPIEALGVEKLASYFILQNVILRFQSVLGEIKA